MTGQPTETKRLPKDIAGRAAGRARGQAPHLRPRPAARSCGRRSGDSILAGLEPLRAAGQLGSVLLQYPKWFFPTSESRDLILEARASCWATRGPPSSSAARPGSTRRTSIARCASSPTTRSRSSWSTGRRACGAACRRSPRSPSPDLAMVRFHGRRVETWEATRHTRGRAVPLPLQRGRAARMGAAAPEAAEEAREMHILMNNCYANYGSTNARELAAMLGGGAGGREPDPADGPA